MCDPLTRQLRCIGSACLFAAALFDESHAVYAASKPTTHTLAIEGMRFSPAVMEVHVGDVVVWRNTDPFPHTVTADDRSFDSKEIPAERSWKWTATKAGVFPYVCKLHPTMKGTLVVKSK